MTHRRRFLTVFAATTVTAVPGCTGSTGRGSASVEETSEVTMTESQFQPRNVHVDAGTTVMWTNEDSGEHTVTSTSDNWRVDERVPGGETVEHTFEESGVYDVYCTIHGSADLSGMSMKVGVGDAAIESPLGGSGDDNGGGYY